MIEAVAVAGLEGLARALGERLGKGKGASVELKSLLNDVRELRALQDQTNSAVAELTFMFQRLIQESDGLVLSRRLLQSKVSVRFEPTDESPTLGDALMHLDRSIQRLRSELAAAAPQRQPISPEASPKPNGDSIFQGLDEEIQQKRTAGGAGHAAG